MESTWEWIRDFLIILAAAGVIVVSLFTALVSWQVYRLARELRDQLQPILESLQDTAETVRDTAEFMGGRVVSPAVSVFGAAAGARGVLGLLREFYKGIDKGRGS